MANANGNDEVECIENVNDVINEITNRHPPVNEVSRTKEKLAMKPSISNGILKSVKKKQKMYYTHFSSKAMTKVSQYKKY